MNKTSNKNTGWIFAFCTLLFGIAVLLFFALAYPHHLHFQEQYQLFLFQESYVLDVLSLPGGLSDLVGRFLTQFFLYAWVGASLIALTLASLHLLTYQVLRPSKKSFLPYAISFIPSIICCCFMCDENALISAPIALIITLSATLLIQRIGCDKVKLTVAFFSIPIIYMMAGAFTICYVSILIIREINDGITMKKIAISCALLIVALSLPIIWHHLVHYSLSQLYTGPHYYRNLDESPHRAWMAAISVVLLLLLPKKIMQWTPHNHIAIFLTTWLTVMTTGCVMVNRCQSQPQEDIMAYDFMARNAQWNRIIQNAQKRAPRNQISAVALNLALSERDYLTNHMFEFPQNGIAGLLPNFTSDHISPLATSEAFYRLGMINTAQRLVFEAQEAIPDFQKSARCYKRLAETNIINGAYEVARKYLIALQHTLFYRTWATEMLSLISNDDAVDSHHEYGYLRKMRNNQNYFFGGNELHKILVRLLESNPNNKMAFEYLEASCLLAKDIEKATTYYFTYSEPLGYQEIPSAIQQAMLPQWRQDHKPSDPLPDYFQPGIVQGFKEFGSMMQNPEAARKRFGNTYWSYYFFHK